MQKLLSAAFLLLCFSTNSFSQYPAKPIRLIIGFPPGGSADPIGRTVGAALSERLGQPVIAENKPGADGMIGGDAAARSAPDGYTLFYGSNANMTAAIALRKEPLYDPLTAFTPISLLGRTMIVMYTNAAGPKSTAELIARAKASPGKLNYGTGNPLSILAMQQLQNSTGTQMLHVPYKGEGPALPDLLTDRIQMILLSSATAISHAKEGRLRALFVLMDERSPILPEVPALSEVGLGGVGVRQWAGLFAPARLPRDIQMKLSKEMNAALESPKVREQLLNQAFLVQGSTPEALSEINRADLALWRKMVKEAGIPLE
jgi:tripartite-type tricarboxylate transporter receptor subunit TctC